MSGQATARSLTGLLHDLTDEEVWELTLSDNRPGLKEFLQARAVKRMSTVGADQSHVKAARQVQGSPASFVSKTFFLPLPDSEVPSIHQPTILKYRAEATRQGVPGSTPLCYRVAAGFTLKTHAPKAGPCYENFQYLQNWNFPDEPTTNCLIFWIPRLVPASANKTVDEQISHLTEFRNRLELPSYHCSSFGTAALLSGLILAHFKATGEKVPLNKLWTRASACYADGGRLNLDWCSGALSCGDGDDVQDVDVGVFPLGVEPACR